MESADTVGSGLAPAALMLHLRVLALVALALLPGCSGGYVTRAAPTPEAARFVTDDLVRFYGVFDALPPSVSIGDAARRFRDGYFEPGSDGLRAFRDRTGDDETFARHVLGRRDFYRAIRPVLLDSAAARALADSARLAYAALERIYPEARFPDVYLVVGKLSTAGTVRRPGLVLGAEHYASGPDVPTTALTAWQLQAISPPEERVPLVVHELIHAQQNRRGLRKRTLLRKALVEGCADYLTERLVGRHPYSDLEAWARPREAELWAAFEPDLDDADLHGWFYTIPDDPEQPVDVGYVIGAWICEAYVENAPDEAAALRDVIHLEDPERIYRESGYPMRFE